MNRYGEAIRTQRLALGWNEKELARKAGITEKVVREAESGKRILSEALAERLLGCMCGPSDTPVLNPYAQPDEPKEALKTTKPSAMTTLAEAGLLGQVAQLPIIDIRGATVGTRVCALHEGRLNGYAVQGAFYMPCPDDALSVFRIHKGDMLLMVPDKTPEEGALVLVQQGSGRLLAKLVGVGQGVRPARMDKRLEVWEEMPKIFARAILVEFAP